MKKRLNEAIVAKSYGIPSEGELFCEQPVLASGVDLENDRWFIITQGTIQKTLVNESLKPTLGKTKFFTARDKVYELNTGPNYALETINSNPPGQLQTVIGGSITTKRVRQNPVSVDEFRSEMTGMYVGDPRRDFREYDSPKLHSAAFRDKLFTFVSYRGESYGWVKGGKIYHRRGSLIMPKLKVNKAVEGSTLFYHTHPSKDEPSLSSADDYQFYCDLAYAFGIKHFYTIMENRIDHFVFSIKKSKEEDYLKMDEDKFLDDLNAIIDSAEAKVTKKHKNNQKMSDEVFNSTITKHTVSEINKRFSDFVNIKYKGHTRPGIIRDNPGDAGFLRNPPIRISHRHSASQFDELRDTTNNFEHYGANEFGHSKYVYWWVDHYFSQSNTHPKGRLWKLKDYGVDDDTRRKLRDYLSEELAPGYSNLDLLLFLALYHDVGKKREKEQGRHHSIIAAEMFRDEISHELKLPPQVTDAFYMLMMTDCGRKNISLEGFITQAGDHLGVAYLLQVADMLAHHPFMFTTIAKEAKDSGFIDKANVDSYKQKAAEQHFDNIKKFLNNRVKANPPPSVKAVFYEGDYGVPIDGDFAQEALEEYSGQTVPMLGSPLSKNFFYNGQLFCRYPMTDDDSVGVVLYLNRGQSSIKMQSRYMTEDDPFGQKLANKIHREIGEKIAEVNPYEIVLDDPEPAVLVNPRHAKNVHIITITSGLRRAGMAQAIRRVLAEMLGADDIPVISTRPKGGKVVTEKQFLKMIENGEMAQWRKTSSGFYVGRRFADFKKKIAVLDTTLKEATQYAKVFPNSTNVYLESTETPEEMRDRIDRSNSLGMEKAKEFTNEVIQENEKAHAKGFEIIRVHTSPKKPIARDIAERIANDIVKKNPPVMLKARGTDDLLSRFINPETGEELTGRWFDGGVIDTSQGSRPISELGDEITDVDMIANLDGPRHTFNVGKWGDRTIIQGWRLGRYYEKVEIKTPVFLLSNPTEIGEPSAYFATRGFLQIEDPEDYEVVKPGEITDFQGNAKGQRPDMVFKSAVVVSRAEAETDKLWPRANPSTNFFPGEAVEQYPWLRHADLIKQNAKTREEWFMDWAKLINMKNKELEAFLDSPLGKKAGLSASEAKEQGIHSGRVSGRAILRMRKKIALGGPKDYIKGPVHASAVFLRAKKKWNNNDWEWCARQVRFNKRFMGDWFGKRKGPLVRDGQPTRRLLALWVWGFDPWRYARKIEKRKTMPKCPKVPWIGMTEKRKYGVQSEEVRMNPMAPGYQSYGWTTQDWRSIKVNNKGDIDYSEKCGAEGTKTPSGSPRLCLPKKVIQTLMRTESGKEILREQARKKARAKKGERVPWHPRIKKLHGKLEKKTPKDRKKKKSRSIFTNPQTGLPGLGTPPVDPATLDPHLDWPKWTPPAWFDHKMIPKSAVWRPPAKGAGSLSPGYYYIRQSELNQLLQSQAYLDAQEADRQRKIREAKETRERLISEGQQFVDDFRTNPMSLVCRTHGVVAPHQIGQNSVGSLVCTMCGGDLKAMRTDEQGNIVGRQNPEKPIATIQDAENIVSGSTALTWLKNNRRAFIDAKLSRQAVFDMIAKGIASKYGVRYVLVSEEEARKIPYLANKDSFYENTKQTPNPGTWDESAGIVYFNKYMLNDRWRMFGELTHETGAVIIASKYGGKALIPHLYYYVSTRNGRIRPYALTHAVDTIVSGGIHPPIHSPILSNPRIPKKYEGQDPSEHSDLYTDEDPKGTIQGLGFKDKSTAERSINIIRRSGKTHAHKIQAAMAMEQRARFHPHQTTGIKQAQKVYARFIEEMKKKTKAMRNPPNIPFPIPEEYQEELERRLTEEMTSEGYKPHTIPEVIEEGLYDDSPSDFAYAQGEYEEFLEEIEKGDFDEAYAEYSDVEGHVAYWLWTNHRIQVPIYTGTHVDKTRVRIQIFNHLFNQYGLKFEPKYLKGGSNYEKVHKVRKALDAAADDQGKPRSKDTDEEMAKKVATSVAAIVKKNPPLDYPDNLAEAFEMMKRQAKKNRELEMTEGFDAYGWWKFEQKDAIDAKYGEDVVPGASWKLPVFDPNFDPHIPDKQPQPNYEDDFYPLKPGQKEPDVKNHFYNQLMRIPQTSPPTPRKILQVALNIGQGHANGTVTEDYTIDDFIEVSA